MCLPIFIDVGVENHHSHPVSGVLRTNERLNTFSFILCGQPEASFRIIPQFKKSLPSLEAFINISSVVEIAGYFCAFQPLFFRQSRPHVILCRAEIFEIVNSVVLSPFFAFFKETSMANTSDASSGPITAWYHLLLLRFLLRLLLVQVLQHVGITILSRIIDEPIVNALRR